MREFGIDKASQALDFLLGGCSRCPQFRPCLSRKLRGFYYLKLMIINYCYLKFRDICHLGILAASLLSTGPIRGLLKELKSYVVTPTYSLATKIPDTSTDDEFGSLSHVSSAIPTASPFNPDSENGQLYNTHK
jgi:hypothetical protein